MTHDSKDLTRFTVRERVNHWLVAISFVLLALSGLSFFHPAFWPLTQLFGGGVWTRILHPYIGLLMLVLFISMFIRFRMLNVMSPDDWIWIKRIREFLFEGNERNMPAQDKFNAGEKLMFWSLSVCLLLMVISGLIMWYAFFTFPAVLVRLAAVIHAAVGAIMIGLVFFHIYAAIWTKGTIQAMLFGTVSRTWARYHHAKWYRQMTGG